jgi:hypothetical protein
MDYAMFGLFLPLVKYNGPSILILGALCFVVLINSRQGQSFSLLHKVQTLSGAHPDSYPMGTRGSFHGNKAAVA